LYVYFVVVLGGRDFTDIYVSTGWRMHGPEVLLDGSDGH
jgi:hypothetical protein